MHVRDLMTREVSVVAPGTPLIVAARTMRDGNVGHLVVADGNELMGLITDRDIVVRVVADGANLTVATVRDAMSTIVHSCLVDDEVEEAARIMNESKVQRLLVTSRDGQLCGMIAFADLAGWHDNTKPYRVTFYRRLSSSQGEIRDVALARIYVSPNHPREEVVDTAIQRFEREQGGSPWDRLADRYEVEGPE